VDFTEIYINLSGGSYESLAAAKEAGAATINFGVFINTVLNFLIVAFAIFLLIRNVNRLKRKEEAAPAPAPTTRDCPHCLSSIPIKATRCAHCTSQLEPA
jgi:large conductance mechanosensitive channel